jgi:hypothetical protein
MSLHKALAALLEWRQQRQISAEESHIWFSPDELTAFALAVARAERARCCDRIAHFSCGCVLRIDALPDPAWAEPTP